jgi:membrane protease YdiL (CAAX protease family)
MKKTLAPIEKESAKPAAPTKKRRALAVVGWTLWVAAAFFLTSLIVTGPLAVMIHYGVIKSLNDLGTAGTFWIDALMYIVMFFVVMWLPWHRYGKSKGRQKRHWIKFLSDQVGLKRLPNFDDVRYFVANLPVYYLVLIVLSIAASALLGDKIMSEQQSTGFSSASNGLELILIFLALVVVAPLFEEMMMRGFLFSKLRQYLPLWPAAIIVSLLFAVAHGQVNVGIMTFILSMFNCRMREKTGSIWAGVFLHMAQNFLAFSILFLRFG